MRAQVELCWGLDAANSVPHQSKTHLLYIYSALLMHFMCKFITFCCYFFTATLRETLWSAWWGFHWGGRVCSGASCRQKGRWISADPHIKPLLWAESQPPADPAPDCTPRISCAQTRSVFTGPNWNSDRQSNMLFPSFPFYPAAPCLMSVSLHNVLVLFITPQFANCSEPRSICSANSRKSLMCGDHESRTTAGRKQKRQ